MISFRYFFAASMLIEGFCLDALGYGIPEFDRFDWSFGPCQLDISDPCAPDKILFYLYSSDDINPVNIAVGDGTLPEAFNVSVPTKVLIHGYAGSVDFRGITVVRNAYQRTGSFNIIVVDWGELAKLPCYPTAVINTAQAGKCTALLLSHLASLKGPEPSDIHAIGFSLGAHVASFASNDLLKIRGKRFGRITGLDPALPFFASLTNSWKLDQEDADFVDVIHTNVGIFGKIEPTGHADFYVNEGFSQPGCKHAENIPLCSHVISLSYYAESITTNATDSFWGVHCSSYIQHLMGWCQASKEGDQALMGEYCDNKTRGVYFVRTRDEPPFALGKRP